MGRLGCWGKVGNLQFESEGAASPGTGSALFLFQKDGIKMHN